MIANTETETVGAAAAAPRPPMGWNCYNAFCCEPTEALLKEAADAIVASGLAAAGYVYVNIDDGWMAKERGSDGELLPHPDKFPNGLACVADYIHGRGLKAGIYLGAGLRTYGEYPGSLGHEEADAKLIADWGFDLLKYDYRNLPEDPPRGSVESEYRAMAEYLGRARQPILFSICEHGRSDPWKWGRGVGHMWRVSRDIKDGPDGEISWGWGFNAIVDSCRDKYEYAGPGGWNDPDMLIVGLNGKLAWQGPGCTPSEYRAHFALWCLMAAPLILGFDVRNMDAETADIVLNRELIAVNQDELGEQGRVLRAADDLEVWVKRLAGGALALGLYNRRREAAAIEASWAALGLARPGRVRDLWRHADITVPAEGLSLEVPARSMEVLRIEP